MNRFKRKNLTEVNKCRNRRHHLKVKKSSKKICMNKMRKNSSIPIKLKRNTAKTKSSISERRRWTSSSREPGRS